MLLFDNCGLYIQSQTTIRARIDAIDAIIVALENQALTAAGTSNISEYQLNDGQTIIKEVYRNSESIAKAIIEFEGIKQRYISKLEGRVFRGMDSKNFRNRYGSRF